MASARHHLHVQDGKVNQTVSGSPKASAPQKGRKNMKEYIFTELGYFTEKECENIKNALDGKTYMNFSITWSNCAGNCTLIVRTDYEDTEENIKRFFFHVALSELARK